MRTSEHYNLNLVEGTDLVNPLTQDVPNYEAIDSAMYENQIAAVQSATELKTGTVHAITRADEGAEMFRFTATSNWTAGDTMTVDGAQVSVFLPSGEALGTGAYVVNSEVLCAIKGTRVTAFIPEGVVTLAADSEKLNGQSADFYATAENLGAVEAIATAGAELAQSANNIATAAKSVTDNIGAILSSGFKSGISMVNNTAKTIASLTLPEGTWMLLGSISFAPNANGYREIGIGDAIDTSAVINRAGAFNGNAALQCVRIVSHTSPKTYHVTGMQNSGLTIIGNGSLIGVRIK